MTGPWRKIEDPNGYPQYFNDNFKQWDHPKFSDIKQCIDECNYIKFSSYRVASKIRVLQRALYMDEIPISMISGVFDKHRLGANEASLLLESYDLEAILADIYFAANKTNHTNIDIDFAIELMQNFIYNVYDKDRKDLLQVVSTKIALSLLSTAKLSELYRYFYTLCADHNNTVTRYRLQKILTHLTKISQFLHEEPHFGPQLIQTSLENCFKDSPGIVGLTERGFLVWLETGPQILSFIPTLYRMKTAETVMHNATCSVCKCSPLIGLKYRCVRCSRYTQCQKCFLSARITHSHKVGHPMREYCTEKCTKELNTFIKRICSILRCSLKLPSNPSDFIEPQSLRTDTLKFKTPEASTDCNITPLSSPQTQLQVVIRQLEIQNRELNSKMLQLHHKNEKEIKLYLEEHRIHIAVQIQKLKLLKDFLHKSQTQKPELKHLESTPMVKNVRTSVRDDHMDLLSPIIRPPDFSAIPEASHCETWERTQNVFKNQTQETNPLSIRDISSWINDRPASSSCVTGATSSTYIPSNSTIQQEPRGHVSEMQHDLDAVLDKLQQILANNFSLDESLSSSDNDQLQEAVSEVEGMLTSLIDGVECSRTNSVLDSFPLDRETLLF